MPSDGRSVAEDNDAMIAAIALARGPHPYTSNPDDFTGIPDLEVVPVPVI